jgi:RecJ-like exonuclease
MEIKCTKCGGSGKICREDEICLRDTGNPLNKWIENMCAEGWEDKPCEAWINCPDCEGKGGHRPERHYTCNHVTGACEQMMRMGLDDCNYCKHGEVSRPLTEDEIFSLPDSMHIDGLTKLSKKDKQVIIEQIIALLDWEKGVYLDGQPVTLEPYKEEGK